MFLNLIFLTSLLVYPCCLACDTNWPTLGLMLPISFRDNLWKTVFFRSFLLFWPIEISRMDLVAVVDEEESKEHLELFHDFAKDHAHRFVHGISAKPNPAGTYYGSGKFGKPGYDRQQFLMFYPENYTSTEYVGFVDSDTLFTTYVDKSDIFENGKPVVHVRFGPYDGGGGAWLWSTVANTTLNILGVEEPGSCMDYFPIVFKSSHIIELRRYLETKFQMSFRDVFQRHFVNNYFSQFNIFCAYMWAHHRHEYSWHIDDVQPTWDMVSPPVWRGQLTNRSAFTDEMKVIKPRIALHASYRMIGQELLDRDHKDTKYEMQEILALGVCLSPPFPRNESFCKCIQPHYDTLFEDYFMFESYNWNAVVQWKLRQDAQETRYARIQKCHHNFSANHLTSLQPMIDIQDGWGITSPVAGRTLYYNQNCTLRKIPNWGTALALNAAESHAVSGRMFANLLKGPGMPPMR